MALSDQTLVCRDCNEEFVFTAGEQEFYASHRLTNTPSRCPSCRAARKGQGGYGGFPRPRQMYNTKWSSCGKEGKGALPPPGGKAVFFNDLYPTQKTGKSNDRR